MVNFKDGELVKGAYVVIDGKEYEVHMPQYSGETPLSSENLNKMQAELLNAIFPIGSTYITQDNTNPSEILKFGTWERLKGKVCLGLDEDDEDLNEVGKTGGEKTHTLTIEEMPEHNHKLSFTSAGTGSGEGIPWSGSTNFVGADETGCYPAGEGQSHNNLQPYEIVGYMWIRRA